MDDRTVTISVQVLARLADNSRALTSHMEDLRLLDPEGVAKAIEQVARDVWAAQKALGHPPCRLTKKFAEEES